MAIDRNTGDAIERLNALIDGELPPSEHAALADWFERHAVEPEAWLG